MAKYRKKPIVIEAILWNGKNVYEIYCFINGKPDNHSCRMAEDAWYDYERSLQDKPWNFKTLESDGETQKADVGDWIIKGLKGECYPCKPNIFNLSYDRVG